MTPVFSEQTFIGSSDGRAAEGSATPRREVGPWTAGGRALLTILAMLGGAALLIGGRGVRSADERSSRIALVLVLDLNAAPAEVLSALPSIGPKLAEQIVEARRLRPFVSIADFRGRTRGIGPATLARLAPHLRFGPVARRIDPVASLPSNRLARVD